MLLVAVALTAATVGSYGAAPKKQRSSADVKKEQKATRRAIASTNKKVAENQRRTAAELNSLNSLNAEMAEGSRNLAQLRQRLDSVDRAAALLADTVADLERRLQSTRAAYAASVKAMRSAKRQNLTPLAFVFSSESFNQVYRRMRYLREFSAWRQRQASEIAERQTMLVQRADSLKAMRERSSLLLKRADAQQRQIESQQKRTDALVKKLRREGSRLKTVLKQNQQKAARLDAELERIIAEEIKRQQQEERRKKEAEKRARAKEKKKPGGSAAPSGKSEPAPAATTEKPGKKPDTAPATASKDSGDGGADFAKAQGRLLFPVEGKSKIVRPFGRQKHPQLPHVMINNSGIDIEATRGASARAVYAGKVSAIFRQPGFNTIVMVRHGRYLTIYANLSSISVKNGQTLKAGQTIGRIFSDPDDSNRTILHFEIRKEKEKLNPMLWLE